MTWSPIGPVGAYIESIVAVQGTVFVGTGGAGVYKSLDKGASWQEANGSTEKPLSGSYVYQLIVHESELYAATNNLVFKSADGGETWLHLDNDYDIRLSRDITGLSIFNNNIYAGTLTYVLKLPTNLDGSWTSISGEAEEDRLAGWIRNIAFYENKLYAASSLGIYESENEGQTWQRSGGQNFSDAYQFGVFDGLYAATGRQSIYLSGQEWKALPQSIQGEESAILTGHYMVSRHGNNIYFGGKNGLSLLDTQLGHKTRPVSNSPDATVYSMTADVEDLFLGTNQGVFRKLEDNDNWDHVNGSDDAFLHNFFVSDMLSDEEALYVATNGSGIFKRLHSSQNWTAINGSGDNKLGSLNVNALQFGNNILYAATGDGIFKSLNKGESWNAVTGTENNPAPTQGVFGLLVNGTALFAINGDGPFESLDQGENWQLLGIPGGLQSVYITGAGLIGETIFIGTEKHGVYKRDFLAPLWQLVHGEDDILEDTDLTRLDVSGNTLFLHAGGKGFYSSEDQGETWKAINGQEQLSLENTFVTSVHKIGDLIYAGFQNGGVVVSQDDGQSWSSVGTSPVRHHKNDTEITVLDLLRKDDTLYVALGGRGIYEIDHQPSFSVNGEEPAPAVEPDTEGDEDEGAPSAGGGCTLIR
jgi:hypothetical protein